jgi:DNA-binding response OmpR family regulator
MHHPIRALLVIAEPSLVGSVKQALNQGVYLVRMAPSVEDVRGAVLEWQPHLALIDIDMIQHESLNRLGYSALGIDHVPAIALTRRGDLQTKLDAFAQGADDVIVVPFAREELAARVLVIVRRTFREASTLAPPLHLGDLEVDILNRRVRVRGEDVRLTSLERDLLYLLASNSGRLLSRDEILNQIWGVDYVAESNVVDRHVYSLRAKLQNCFHGLNCIATVHGRGYRFEPPAVDNTRPTIPSGGLPLATQRSPNTPDLGHSIVASSS